MKHDENTALAYDFVHEFIDSDGVFFLMFWCVALFFESGKGNIEAHGSIGLVILLVPLHQGQNHTWSSSTKGIRGNNSHHNVRCFNGDIDDLVHLQVAKKELGWNWSVYALRLNIHRNSGWAFGIWSIY